MAIDLELPTYVLINPASRTGYSVKVWEEVAPLFAQAGAECRVVLSTAGENMEISARHITETADGPIQLIVLGGDGSLNEVINGIRDLTQVTLGYIPTGSGNDFARSIGIEDEQDAARKILADGAPVMRDLGEIRCRDSENGNEVIRRFLSAAGIGFDAHSAWFTDHTRLKKPLNLLRLGRLNYIISALRLLMRFPLFPLDVTVQDEGRPTTHSFRRARFAVCGNHKYEGGGFQFTPDADGTDGLLDVCVIHDLGRLAFLKEFHTCYDGSHVGGKYATILRGRKVMVRTAYPQYFHTDGEVSAKTEKLYVKLAEHRIRWMA
ncbi:MAG: YegS/Rv2252/BmrU family lipid kinase [Lachnospiraceae bacterium]|nr:YegS/Rv2252/BmrU family lipid kinase [Lachnospiraceae bacterium]